jgi:hypothetical protein
LDGAHAFARWAARMRVQCGERVTTPARTWRRERLLPGVTVT